MLPALRELLSQHPGAANSDAESISSMLHALRYLPSRPSVFDVEAALEALALDGELAA